MHGIELCKSRDDVFNLNPSRQTLPTLATVKFNFKVCHVPSGRLPRIEAYTKSIIKTLVL